MTSWSDAEYVAAALHNVRRTSRTVHGVGDISSSSNKPPLREVGDKLQERAVTNFRRAAEAVLRRRQGAFNSPADVSHLVCRTATIVSAGLLEDGQPLWRTWTTRYPRQVPPEQITTAFQVFCTELYSRQNLPATAGIRLAGWVEYMIDGIIHPFADGCSRTAKVTSLLVLARVNIPLPVYPERDEYYAALALDENAWLAFYERLFAFR
jgi:hypothetical protein